MAETSYLAPGAGSLAEYYEWQNKAKHGDILVYWVGDLQFDRQVQIDEAEPNAHAMRLEQIALDAVAKRIMDDARMGHVVPTQKRLGPGHYQYRAMRVRRVPAMVAKETIETDGNRVLA